MRPETTLGSKSDHALLMRERVTMIGSGLCGAISSCLLFIMTALLYRLDFSCWQPSLAWTFHPFGQVSDLLSCRFRCCGTMFRIIHDTHRALLTVHPLCCSRL